MTMHTAVYTTTPGVTTRQAFDKMRELIGATDKYRYEHREDDNSYHMGLGQGLHPLLWVQGDEENLILKETCEKWCEKECSGEYHNPAHYVEIHFDTGYEYTAHNGAKVEDLHAWIKRELCAWLDELDVKWVWYDESGKGWKVEQSGYGTLGDPDLGDLNSTKTRW